MGKRLTNEELMEKVVKMIPAGLPEWLIGSAEVDVANGFNGYLINLSNGFICKSIKGKEIHEKTLTALKTRLSEVEIWESDPAFEEDKTKTKDKAYWNKYCKLLDKSEDKNSEKSLTKQEKSDKVKA